MDSVEIENGNIVLHLINRGPVPAFNITAKAYSGTKKPEGIIDDFSTKPGFNTIDLGPSEIYHISVGLPMDVNPQQVKMFYGFRIEYEDLNKKKRHYLVRGHFTSKTNITDKLKID